MKTGVALILLCAAIAARPAAAIELDHGIRQYRDNGGVDPRGDILFLATVGNPAAKGAGVVLHLGRQSPGDPGGDIVVGFLDKSEWQAFLALWNRARSAIVPEGMTSQDVGFYADAHEGTRLTLAALVDGTIEFRFVGKASGQYAVRTFDLLPEAFVTFDEDLKTVAAYFGP